MNEHNYQILLAPVTAADLDFIAAVECNAEIWCYEESVETDANQVKAKYLEQISSEHNFDFIITRTTYEGAEPIGLASIWSYVEHRKSWEIGFGLLPYHQGFGYGYSATKQLIHYAFEKLNAHKVVAMCNSNNLHSARLMKNVGMRREGIFREELEWKDVWVDQWFFSILKREWKS
ncbi:GNAT family N-acetyltransferase [Paenibacillus daejeonensis]|uniref:GNAT family N-acetyltransferase n=1 Tax=Paenibacillus daejeonensis TaxID=135193 RepID=UPI00036FEA26|nr:GNAT family protein [Paenibacillus daejeonensis]